ncbi:hypothetical protein SO802_009077 [Lithocarpus litseifolius]|uniref:Uncharacterized protein n=1 Tax=Lithocarpus litseifolius TaxID=425828 RepID=A0AAW2DAC6_9ROSI
MADSSPYTKTHFPFSELNTTNPKCKGKSFTNFFFKALFFAILLLALPLFPSQAPEFINQTILTKFWELIHLLFIGIAVSYGLFSRRNAQMGMEETHSNFDNSLSYVSRMLNVTSIFEDGFENPCGSDEKRVIFDSEHMGLPVCSNGSAVVEEQCEPHFSMYKNGFENPYGCDQNNVVQAWNSQYFQGESVVVVAQPCYDLDECGKPGSFIDYKPLGLPVRSLKSKVRKRDGAEFTSGSESSSGSKGSSTSRSSDSRRRGGNFGDLGPMKLEQEFDEAAAAAAAAVASSIPWRSRSMRNEMRNRVGNGNRTAHFRPHSVDETQFESLKSQSFTSTASFSSHASSVSSSQSISSESQNSSTEALGKQKRSQGAFSEASLSPRIPKNDKGSLNVLHSRHYSIGSASGRDDSRSSEDELKEWSRRRREDPRDSIGSASDRDVSRSSKDELKEWSRSRREDPRDSISSASDRDISRSSKDESKEWSRRRREDPRDSKESSSDSSKLNMSPTSLTKAFSRGKSVRTIRASGLPAGAMKNGEICQNQIDHKDEKRRENLEEAYMRKDKAKVAVESMMIGTSKQNLDNPYPMPNGTNAKYHKKGEFSENATLGSEQDSESEAESFQVSSEEDDVPGSVDDAGPYSDEVDKKAGEFIAKFREQIRLQKMASIGRSRGVGMGGNHFR